MVRRVSAADRSFGRSHRAGDHLRRRRHDNRDRRPERLRRGRQRRPRCALRYYTWLRRQCLRREQWRRRPPLQCTTGQFVDTFVSQASGGLSDVYGLAFGPDGNLYVASGATDEVLRYNGTTGAFMDAFVVAGSGGLDYPRGVTFGADGNLYVSSSNTHSILRYQGPLAAAPGAPLPASGKSGATFVAPSSGGLYSQLQLIFGPDGNLYADGGFMPGVARYDSATGAFLNTFVPNSLGGLAAGRGMAFDQEGRFYVGDSYSAVRQYDSQGNFLADLLVNAVSTPLSKPHGMIFDSQGALGYHLRRFGHDRSLRPRCVGEPIRGQFDGRDRGLLDRRRIGGVNNRLLCQFRHGPIRARRDIAADLAGLSRRSRHRAEPNFFGPVEQRHRRRHNRHRQRVDYRHR
jgi:hypothetical protein